MSRYFSRLPTWAQIAPVYAVIVLIVYSWTILWFFWRMPGWLYYLNAGEILMAYAYSMATNFVESLVVLSGLLILGIALPKKWFCDVFVARGAALVMAGLGYMMYLGDQFKNTVDFPKLALQAWTVAVAVVGILLIVFLAGRISIIRRVLELLADRATVFLFISIPLSTLAMLVIVARSLI